MPSATYELFREAILGEKRVTCTYDGYPRELCPIILGHSEDEEKVLAYQVGGSSSKGLPRGGEWKCLFLSKVKNPRVQDGPWREDVLHRQEQRCVDSVDIDINIHVRKRR
jgi:hypothetical protein